MGTDAKDIRLIIPTSARTVLLVGCGDGALGKALKQERSVEVTGIEMSPAATKAREVLDRVFSGSAEVIADRLPPAHFDCIAFTDSLERLPNPVRAISALKRCLRPDGVIAISARNSRAWPVLKALLEDNYAKADDSGKGSEKDAAKTDGRESGKADSREQDTKRDDQTGSDGGPDNRIPSPEAAALLENRQIPKTPAGEPSAPPSPSSGAGNPAVDATAAQPAAESRQTRGTSPLGDEPAGPETLPPAGSQTASPASSPKGLNSPRASRPRDLNQERQVLLSKAALIDIVEAAGLQVASVRSIRELEQQRMPDALRVAIEEALGLKGSTLFDETQDAGYLILTKPLKDSAAKQPDLPIAAEVPNVEIPEESAQAQDEPEEAIIPAGKPRLTAAMLAESRPSQNQAQGQDQGRRGSSIPHLPRSPGSRSTGPLPPARPPVPGASKTMSPGPRRKPIASIVVLTWNQKALIETLLPAIGDTTKVPHEVIVIDNGSTDDTAAFLKAYSIERNAAAPESVRVISNPQNLGIAKGFNQGLKEAKGDYIILLHNDVVLPPKWLEHAIRHFRTDKRIGIVGPRSNVAKSHQVAQPGYRDLGEFAAFAEKFYERNQGNQTQAESLGDFCMAVSRETLSKIGLMDESYEVARYEDQDLCMRARQAGLRLVVADDIYVHHSGGDSFKKNGMDVNAAAEANRGRFIDRWGLRPKIAYLTRWSGRSMAGQSIFKQANDAADLGYQVTVFSLGEKPPLTKLGAEFRQVGAFELLPSLDEDIVVVCSAQDLPVIAPKCRGKLVHLCLGYESYYHGLTADDALAEKPQFDRYYSLPCARIVSSLHLQSIFKSTFEQETLLVPEWPNPVLGVPRQSAPAGALKNPCVLFAGRPTASKGFADFAAAVKIVRGKHKGISVQIAVPPRTDFSQEQVEALTGGPVTVHSGLSQTEMESLYRSADVAVFPSWYEGSPIAVLSAMMCGVPVVTADSRGGKDVCRDGENSLVVPPAYPKKLATAICRVIEDEKLRSRLTAEGPKAASAYTREASLKALDRALDTIFRWETVPESHRPSSPISRGRVVPGLTSIVIVTLNALEFTKRCIDSIFTYADADPVEIIVVDNGSTDGTWTFLETLSRKRKDVRILRNPHNTGLAYAANQGILLSAGEFVVSIHNDTVVTKGWLRRMKRIASSVPSAGLVGPVSNGAPGDQEIEGMAFNTMDDIQGYAGAMSVRLAGQTVDVNRLSGFCFMAKRELLDQIGIFDTLYTASGFEGDDLSVRARIASFRCIVAKDVFIYHFGERTYAANGMEKDKTQEPDRRRFMGKWAKFLREGGDESGTKAGSEDGAALTGAERLAKRIASRSAFGGAQDESMDRLPPEEMGPLPVPPGAAKKLGSGSIPVPAGNSGREQLPAAKPGRKGKESDPVRTGPESGKIAKQGRAAQSDKSATDGSLDDDHEPEMVDAAELRGKADAQLKAGRYIIALALFERILKIRPLDAYSRFYAAKCSIHIGDTRKARRYLNSLISQPEPQADSDLTVSAEQSTPPAPCDIYNLFGVSFMAEAEYPAAVTCFEKALAIDPGCVEAAKNLKDAHSKIAKGKR